jgi:hypothetical protein
MATCVAARLNTGARMHAFSRAGTRIRTRTRTVDASECEVGGGGCAASGNVDAKVRVGGSVGAIGQAHGANAFPPPPAGADKVHGIKKAVVCA